MCGRYVYYSSDEILKQYSVERSKDLQLALEMPDNYNVSPSNLMPVIVRGDQEHMLEMMVWGLIPSWSDSASTGYKLINARRETLLQKPMWKRLLKDKRCVVPARGFYEWKKVDGHKYPHYITSKTSNVISFAGLWDAWKDKDGKTTVQSYTIITTAPNKEMSTIHDRMPVILDYQSMDLWLQPIELSQSLLDDVLSPAPEDSLNLVRVSTEVNNTRNNKQELIYPLEDS